MSSGDQWGVWDGDFTIKSIYGAQVRIGESGNRGLAVYGPLTTTGNVSGSITSTGSFGHLELGRKASNFASAAPNSRIATDGAIMAGLMSYDTNYYNHGYHTVVNKSNSTQLHHYGYYGHTFSTQGKDEAMVVSRSGNVGIGNVIPTEALVVEGSVSASLTGSFGMAKLKDTTYPNLTFPAAHSADKIRFYDGGNEKLGTAAHTLIYTAASHSFKDTDGHENLKITPVGDIVMLATGKLIFDGADVSGTYIAESTNDVVDHYVGGTLMLRIEESGTDYVQVFDNTKFVVGTGKDLEILHDGTNSYINSRTGDLHISSSASDGDIKFCYNDGGTMKSFLTMDSSANAIAIAYGTPLSFANGQTIYDNGGGGLAIKVPTYTLDLYSGNHATALGTRVYGNGTTLQFLMSRSADFHADGDVFAASTQVGSDIRLKDEVEDLNYGLDEVLKLRPVEFDWKTRRGGRHDIGVIAQEIESIIPEVVTDSKDIRDDLPYKSVDYSKLTAVLIKAVQEQQEQIKELRKDINKLRGDD
jgi:hypothetical protein